MESGSSKSSASSFGSSMGEAAERATAFMERLQGAARAEACVGPATTADGHTVIPVGRVQMMVGYGLGFGEGAGEGGADSGMGGGGGGGRGASSTIAVIDISQEGVVVRPVLDYTRIILGLFVLAGAFLLSGPGKRALKTATRI